MADRPEFYEGPDEKDQLNFNPDYGYDPDGPKIRRPFTPWSSPRAQAEALADVRESEQRQDAGLEEGPL